MKNKLVVIGYKGCKQCYLNVDKEEALKRFLEMQTASGEVLTPNAVEYYASMVEEIEFDDCFAAYDVWEN